MRPQRTRGARATLGVDGQVVVDLIEVLDEKG